jgi:pantoate--beta-alanine ligase
MVRDLDWPIEIVAVPTIREADGLALSSRNSYLSPSERERAVLLSRSLHRAHLAWQAGERRASAIEATMRQVLDPQPEVVVEYIAIVEPHALAPVAKVDSSTIVAIAARVGETRLIDNIELDKGIA